MDHHVTIDSGQAASDLRRLLGDLGAEPDLLRRIVVRRDLGDREYVSVPPLPAHLVAHLVRLLPGEVVPC